MVGGLGSFLIHSKIGSLVKDIDFPISKQDLITHAEDHDVSQEVLNILDKIPDRIYNDVNEVMEQVRQTA